jgi:hypothetical protein
MAQNLGPAVISIGAMPSRAYINDPSKNFENTHSPDPVGRDTGPDVGSRQMNTLTQLRYQQMDASIFIHTPFAEPRMNLLPQALANIRMPVDTAVSLDNMIPGGG